ncbi:hypothetical protein NM688_g2387 [Phlebia brevispora]|uniref:Uncharacterized protein n=1 Tax=Phlebia brevispora TaxID=194682 RepID=A0ACC1T8Q6_9APHY|nr:hypothetical protein NM688_g2387 [Phlebia brevispora]
MSIGQGQAHESHFGPTSELIEVSAFLQSAQSEFGAPYPQSSSSIQGSAREEWLTLSEDTKRALQEECSVSDLRSSLNNIVVNPRLMAHVTRTHDASLQSIYETADTSNRRKRKRVTVLTPDQEQPEVTALQQKLDQVQLKSWPLMLNSALFIRTPRHADSNTLTATKRLAFSHAPADQNQALVFVTVYNRLQWGHRLVARSSQHVLLSSQTLGDLMESIPCVSNEIPEEQVDENGVTTWTKASATNTSGSVICLEGVAYGDGQSEADYSVKLLKSLQDLPEQQRASVTRGPPMHDATFESLKIHLHQPYWMIHSGDCEHFFVVEQIRLHHPSDPPPSDYPLTTQITPPLLDVCRACNKVPALYSILGDIRLGESPFMICGPCWRWLGMPHGEGADQVTVVPLPAYELGWSG